MTQAAPPSLKDDNKRTGIIMLVVAGAMLCLSFASVPLYKVFCQKTGFGGTPRITLDLPTRVEDRFIKVHFNSDISKTLPWQFQPLQQEVRVRAGELGLAFFRVKNLTQSPLVGIAVYNVTPDKAGLYFNKVACFCFEEQTIHPGEEVDMPVQFFIDPDIVKDPNIRDLKAITLSYTFYSVKEYERLF